MNEKIDVIGIMLVAGEVAASHGLYETHDALKEARAAVADLIAAAWRAQLLLRDMADAGFGDHGPSNDLKGALEKTVGA